MIDPVSSGCNFVFKIGVDNRSSLGRTSMPRPRLAWKDTATMNSKYLVAFGVCALASVFGWSAHADSSLEDLTLTTEFAPHGFHAPFYLALKNGWYEDAGVNLTIRDGKGTANTINLVGAEQTDVGFTSLGAMAIAVAKGVPVKAIASILHRNIYGLILSEGSTLKEPADFRGKEILYNTSSIEAQVFQGFLTAGGMSLSDVKMVGVDSSAKVSSVLSGKGDAAVGPVPYYLGLLAGKNEIETVSFYDFGQKILDFGLIANDATIEDKADALKAFVEVTSRAYQYAIDGHADEAVKAIIELRPDARLDYDTTLAMFESHAKFLDSEDSKGKPVGYMSAADWDETVATLKRLELIPASATASEMYTTEFSPK
ncbi:ABC transporter substrate-binding protein [Acuticoccus mangrovi]|uniref:ABC transporter substrate-binding protein n=1 Tax=Acuticoccus mangrovi TaxID=2796142 RepID=UPI0018E995F0